MESITVVKIGGATLGKHDTAIEDIVELQKQGRPVVVVHGGGKVITEWLTKLGITSQFIQGERVTDQTTLKVVTAVLAGLVNKEIVAAINTQYGQAVGITGIDGAVITGRIKDKAKGHVGEVTTVNTDILESLIKTGYIPVIAPLGINCSPESADTPATLNFNADTVAGEVAVALAAEKLVFLTDVAGVCDQSGRLLSRLTPAEAEALIDSGIADGGMIPKINACLQASSHKVTTAIVDGREPHALLREINKEGIGTIIGVIK